MQLMSSFVRHIQLVRLRKSFTISIFTTELLVCLSLSLSLSLGAIYEAYYVLLTPQMCVHIVKM